MHSSSNAATLTAPRGMSKRADPSSGLGEIRPGASEAMRRFLKG
jgi:hypothetical protein